MEDNLVYLQPALFQKFLKIQHVSVMYCFLTTHYVLLFYYTAPEEESDSFPIGIIIGVVVAIVIVAVLVIILIFIYRWYRYVLIIVIAA